MDKVFVLSRVPTHNGMSSTKITLASQATFINLIQELKNQGHEVLYKYLFQPTMSH